MVIRDRRKLHESIGERVASDSFDFDRKMDDYIVRQNLAAEIKRLIRNNKKHRTSVTDEKRIWVEFGVRSTKRVKMDCYICEQPSVVYDTTLGCSLIGGSFWDEDKNEKNPFNKNVLRVKDAKIGINRALIDGDDEHLYFGGEFLQKTPKYYVWFTEEEIGIEDLRGFLEFLKNRQALQESIGEKIDSENDESVVAKANSYFRADDCLVEDVAAAARKLMRYYNDTNKNPNGLFVGYEMMDNGVLNNKKIIEIRFDEMARVRMDEDFFVDMETYRKDYHYDKRTEAKVLKSINKEYLYIPNVKIVMTEDEEKVMYVKISPEIKVMKRLKREPREGERRTYADYVEILEVFHSAFNLPGYRNDLGWMEYYLNREYHSKVIKDDTPLRIKLLKCVLDKLVSIATKLGI